MGRSRPTARVLADLRAAAHRDVDAVFDAWPAMVDLSGTVAGRRLMSDADLIRGQGDLSDPTLRQALNITAASSWRRDMLRLVNALQTMAARAVDMIGDLPDDACHLCRHYLDDGRPTHKANGRPVHRQCYDRQRSA